MEQPAAVLLPRPHSAAPSSGIAQQQPMADAQAQAFSPQYALDGGAAAAAGRTAAGSAIAAVGVPGAADAAPRLARPSPDFLADRHQPPPGCFGAFATRPRATLPARARASPARARAPTRATTVPPRAALAISHLNTDSSRPSATARRRRPEGGVRGHAGARAAAHPDRPDEQLLAVPDHHRGLDVRGRRGVQAEPVRRAALRALLRPGAAARQGQEVATPARGNVLHTACG